MPVAGCLRCRLLASTCDCAKAGCSACAAAGVECLQYPELESDELLGVLGRGTARGSVPAGSARGRRRLDGWVRSPAAAEFLAEEGGVLRGPECIDDFAENPARLRPASGISVVATGPLAAALERHPEEPGAARLRLPSSELLRCISDAVARSDAEDPRQQFSEHMCGSSLLALGVLLQEYSRHLLGE
ncbi:hypothetical protein H4R21_000910 [Coemansia helicoidea]|uniref:Uncharacterized protein n=1 Tax=Coemansia helicoidea TaxID=1286919 RepID=A0ACC1LF48_9FUNG|nr:hypothetical protein H4R21_000910 [Coemansia helicoidea]